jgi:cytochrome b561
MADRARYNAVAIGLHWLIALGIAIQLILGLSMAHQAMPVAQKFALFQLHKSIGITVLLAILLRVLWRLTHRPPPLPAATPPLERRAAHGAHLLLYALMLGLPLSGWALVSASVFNIPTVLYGVIPWPHLPILSTLADKKPVEDAFGWLHAWMAWSIIALLVLHIGAVARHQLRGDGVLWRMAPFWPRRA